MAKTEFETNSSVRGYHVYQDNWTPVIGERLNCEREEENPRDRYAVAIRNAVAAMYRHGIMIKFSNCEEGKLSMVKLSRFAKIRENRESFPPRMF